MSKKLVIFCIPLSGLGHINASVGLCEQLLKNGHRIVFGVERSWKGKFLKYGFEEQVYEERETKGEESGGKFWSDFFNRVGTYFRGDFTDNVNVTREGFTTFVEIIKYSDKRVKEIIEKVKPDVIIQDNYVAYPSIVKSGIPYIILWSANPLEALDSPNLPPVDSSEPLNDSSNWKKLTDIRNKAIEEQWQSFNTWMLEEGLPELRPYRFQYDSDHLNIVMYPKSLFEDYRKRVSLGDNWMLLEHAVRETRSDFRLPELFKLRPGKVVYVSMGSMATGDVDLMKRLVNLLSKSKHKFIVSLGSRHDEYELADNMYGEPLLPQLEVLKMSDVFITHGGNNSFIEGLYFGVPMIVMPLFADQYSNSQRIVEMNLGYKMNPFKVTEDELLTKIDELANDTELRQRLSVISNELKASNSLNEIVKRIETICCV